MCRSSKLCPVQPRPHGLSSLLLHQAKPVTASVHFSFTTSLVLSSTAVGTLGRLWIIWLPGRLRTHRHPDLMLQRRECFSPGLRCPLLPSHRRAAPWKQPGMPVLSNGLDCGYPGGHFPSTSLFSLPTRCDDFVVVDKKCQRVRGKLNPAFQGHSAIASLW